MALYGYQQYKPPKPDPNAGFVRYKPPKKRTFNRPRPKPPVRQHPYDPFAPTSDADLRAKALGLSNDQFQKAVEIIRDAIEARSRAGQAAIGGYTQQLGNLWKGAAPAAAAAYGQANQAVSGVNQQVADRLNSFGQNLGGELQGKLALQDAPSNLVGQVAGGATTTAQGVSNANFAKGAAEVSRIAAEGAHAGEYLSKMPGVAGLMGLQHSRELEAQLSKDLSDQLAAESSKAQDTFTQLYLHFVDQEWQKTLARQSGYFKSAQAQADAQYKAQQMAYKRAELAWKRAKAQADRSEKAREANQRNKTQQQAEAGRNARAKQAEANRNKRQNKWQVDPKTGKFKTRLNKKTGKRERIPIKPPKKPGSSSSGL